MKIQIFETYEEMSRAAADLIASQLLLKPDCHLSLTAGSTPIGMFKELVKIYQESSLSFSSCTLYNLEEMVGIPADNEKSCRSYFHRNLLDYVDATDSQLILPDGMADDIDFECAKYEELFDHLPDGRLDMQILGIGADGHIGMNRPNENLIGASHPVYYGEGKCAAAMGVRHILLAKRILLLANGEAKAQAVADMCSGQITTAVPATLLQLHPDVTVLLDKAAAGKL